MHDHLNTDPKQLTGSSHTHLVEWSVSDGQKAPSSTTFLVHAAAAKPLLELRQLAAEQGFDLQLCSSFRSFDRQLKIWNDKMLGLRPVYADNGVRLDLTLLTEWQQVQAVMRWSALPGASRHHWGTDFDIYDAAAVDASYRVQLVPEEVDGGGVFAPLHDWLDTVFEAETAVELISGGDFYRPYAKDWGGIAPERWHISYRPVADVYAAQLTVDVLAERLATADIVYKEIVLEHLDELYQRYIRVHG